MKSTTTPLLYGARAEFHGPDKKSGKVQNPAAGRSYYDLSVRKQICTPACDTPAQMSNYRLSALARLTPGLARHGDDGEH
jgi:hypothetical protein